MNSRLLNWLPWSVLNTSGTPQASASVRASVQKSASRVLGNRQAHHVAAVPVHDDHQVKESPGHGQIGDVGRPDLVGPGDPGIPQQVGIDPMLRRRSAGAGTPVDGPQPPLNSRCTRFRLTGMPCRSSQAFIRLDP